MMTSDDTGWWITSFVNVPSARNTKKIIWYGYGPGSQHPHRISSSSSSSSSSTTGSSGSSSSSSSSSAHRTESAAPKNLMVRLSWTYSFDGDRPFDKAKEASRKLLIVPTTFESLRERLREPPPGLSDFEAQLGLASLQPEDAWRSWSESKKVPTNVRTTKIDFRTADVGLQQTYTKLAARTWWIQCTQLDRLYQTIPSPSSEDRKKLVGLLLGNEVQPVVPNPIVSTIDDETKAWQNGWAFEGPPPPPAALGDFDNLWTELIHWLGNDRQRLLWALLLQRKRRPSLASELPITTYWSEVMGWTRDGQIRLQTDSARHWWIDGFDKKYRFLKQDKNGLRPSSELFALLTLKLPSNHPLSPTRWGLA